MIKSKLITILVSTGLTIAIGVGSSFMTPNNEKVNDTTKVQSNSEISSENNESKIEESVVENTTNTTVDSKDEVSSESNNKSNANSDIINTNECIDNNEEYVENQKPADKPSQGSDSGQGSNVAPEESSVSDSSNYIAEIEQAIFQRVNQERSAAGLPALSYNTTMEHYARIKSKDMGDNGYFSHEDKQGNLITVQMKSDGVSYKAWGENIAYIQGTNSNSALATKFMDNWMNSSGHRANILSTNFSSIGIGVYKIGNTYYATQEFYR